MADTILQRVKVDAEAVGDVVELKIGRARARMRYHTAFRVAQDLRLAAKIARQMNHDADGNWSEVGVLNDTNYESGRFTRYHDQTPSRLISALYILAPRAFRGDGLKENKKITVRLDGQAVCLHLGTVVIPFEPEEALKLSTLLRQEGKFAKRFHGDYGKSMQAVGHIHNATPQ